MLHIEKCGGGGGGGGGGGRGGGGKLFHSPLPPIIPMSLQDFIKAVVVRKVHDMA